MANMAPGLTVARLVVVGLLDGLLADICPEDQTLRVEEVHGRRVLQVTDHHRRFSSRALRIHQTHISPVGKEQQGGTYQNQKQS